MAVSTGILDSRLPHLQQQQALENVEKYSWPSRVRGDFGTENNVIEREMIAHWGVSHRPYLRGRSVHNVRIERLWRDVRKDSLENFRQIFLHLEDVDLLCPDSPIHLTCLYLVFHQRIQHSLDETRTSWNNHTIRTARNKTPNAIYQLSRERAINAGYCTSTPAMQQKMLMTCMEKTPANIRPPLSEIHEDPIAPRSDAFASVEEEKDAGVVVTDDEELEEAREALKDMDFTVDDGNWGIDLYCQAVVRLTAYYDNCGTDEESD
ncbi:hypothetical protein DFP72DRAFT_1149225 [Ephemerocybe angulata]|uniref:Integrase core domain-containing protein n=1 Tax=Ephemerocybe angulata TaxID=980116 RepID=A0A8H6HKI8_9AGAR|nr:hypothetical protein DFP72DRAFT_1149225 [Tulosesus angulatus]